MTTQLVSDMAKVRGDFPGSMQKIHLRYIRLPNNTTDFLDECLFRSKQAIVGKSQVSSEHSIILNGRPVLAAGFPIVYFEIPGKWFTSVKVWNTKGEYTGYYCDIVTPFRLLGDDIIEQTDLFLDLWVSPDLRFKVLDQDELEKAFQKGWITEQLYKRAKEELEKLIAAVENGKFPPKLVKELEKKLHL